MFAVINFVTALAPAYPVLLVLRVLAALVAAAISPAVFAVAGTLAAPERVGRAIGTVAAGLTVSLVVGVPIGSWIGDAFGWRATFVCVGAFTCLAIAVTATTLPRLPALPSTGVRERIRVLGDPSASSALC